LWQLLSFVTLLSMWYNEWRGGAVMTVMTKKRTRLTIDVSPEVKRRLRLAAARRDISMRQYMLEVLEERLVEDLSPLMEREGLLTLTAEADPVLAELWDNDKDAAYDHL
jgi:uncharacterized protein (DUF1778 family)